MLLAKTMRSKELLTHQPRRVERWLGSTGPSYRRSQGAAPAILKEMDAPVASWDLPAIIAAIECAAARRS